MSENVQKLAEEGLEWCKDFRDGQFAPAPTRDGWTVEMHGLVDTHERLCRAFIDLLAAVQFYRLKVRPNWDVKHQHAAADCLDLELRMIGAAS